MSFGPEVVHIFSITIQESSILSVKSSFTYAIKFCEKFDPLNLRHFKWVLFINRFAQPIDLWLELFNSIFIFLNTGPFCQYVNF